LAEVIHNMGVGCARAHPVGVALEPLGESRICVEGYLVSSQLPIIGRELLGDGFVFGGPRYCARAHALGVAPEPLGGSETCSKGKSHGHHKARCFDSGVPHPVPSCIVYGAYSAVAAPLNRSEACFHRSALRPTLRHELFTPSSLVEARGTRLGFC